MRQLLRRFCAAGFGHICECADGAAAVQAFYEQQPDWVLMDIAMPEEDGLAATARILAREPAARVIIVSQHDSATFRQAAARAGACGFVSKHDLEPLRCLLGLEPLTTDVPFSGGPTVHTP